MNKIINFHVVSDPRWFEEVVLYLKSKYKMVPVQVVHDFITGDTIEDSLCHITVDDGDISFYKNIYPVLKKHGIPASLFVSPKVCKDELNYWYQEIEGYDRMELKKAIAATINVPLDKINKFSEASILKTLPFACIQASINRYKKDTNTKGIAFQNMTVNNLIEVHESGLVTIGGHTMNHPILKNENDENCRYEIVESVNQLSALLETEISYFAYPNGIPELDFTEREEVFLKSAGIRLAFTTNSGNVLQSDNPMAIPRIGVSDNENIRFLKLKLMAGSYWELVKKLKSKNELSERMQLKKLITLSTIA